ncbi:hypothetical protein [Candidatus Frankia alpina]|uniref:hypothetical protein n=1 Tax=Candidatus Frankia alpina TaxID=2699483 RepID=UPI003013E9B8
MVSPQMLSLMRRVLGGERVHEIVEAFGRCLDVHLVPIPDAPDTVEVVAAIGTDITDRQQALASLRQRSAEQALVADLVQAHHMDETGEWRGLLARADRREPPTAPPLPTDQDTRFLHSATAPCTTVSPGYRTEPHRAPRSPRPGAAPRPAQRPAGPSGTTR